MRLRIAVITLEEGDRFSVTAHVCEEGSGLVVKSVWRKVSRSWVNGILRAMEKRNGLVAGSLIIRRRD